MLKKWLVVHDLEAYRQHPDMIGKFARSTFQMFNEIKKGDHIVYYATKDMVVTGIFEVVSDKMHLENDPLWKEMTIFRTKTIERPARGYYLDFKKLVLDSSVSLDSMKECTSS